jgi:hypothetical protein
MTNKELKAVRVSARQQKSFVVYISCVGKRDPFGEGTEGPLLTCLRYLIEIKGVQFDSIYLIPSSKEASPDSHTEDNAEDCRRILLERMQEVDIQIYPMKAKNPADLKKVYPALRDILANIRCEVKSKVSSCPCHPVFHINVSSGTKQMTDSLAHLVSVGILKSYEVYLWQVFDPCHHPELQSRVQRAPELDLLAQERILFQLEQLTKQHMYQEAKVLLKQELTTDHIEFTKQLYDVLASHDQWLYKYANNILQKILSSGQVPNFMQDWLQGLASWLKEIVKATPQAEVLAIDRYYCGWRRLESGLYPDAINHFWTACELALRHHGENIRAIRPAEQITAFELVERIRGAKQRSPLNNAEIVLQGQVPRSLLDAVDWLRKIRNEVEHGSRPVEEQIARNAKEVAEKVLQTLGWLTSGNFLQPDIVKCKLLQLIQAMRDSLWR